MSAREEIAGLIVKNIELQERIETLEAALRAIATTVSTSNEPFVIKLAIIRNTASAALDKGDKP